MCCNWKYIVFWCRVFAVFLPCFSRFFSKYAVFFPLFCRDFLLSLVTVNPRLANRAVNRAFLQPALSPQKGPKCKTAIFHLKLHFAWRKSATNFLCVKAVSDIVVRHSLAYLSVQKWLMVDVPLNVNFALSEPPLGADDNDDIQITFLRHHAWVAKF